MCNLTRPLQLGTEEYFMKVDQNQFTFPMIPKFFYFGEKTFSTIASWSRDPLPNRKRFQVLLDSLDHAEPQSVEKTNIRQNFRSSDHTPCLTVINYP